MSITSFDELSTALSNWLNRSDLTSRIPEFITLAEDKIIIDLDVSGIEKRATADSSDEYISLPTDYLEMRNLQINSDPVRRLRYVTPEQMDTLVPSSQTGKPLYYTIVGDRLQVRPVPDQSYEYEMAFLFVITRLSTNNATNWVIDNYPSLYLNGALAQAEPFLMNDKRVPMWKSLYKETMDSLNKRHRKGKYSGSALVVRTDTGNP